jgi:hypothetical protein
VLTLALQSAKANTEHLSPIRWNWRLESELPIVKKSRTLMRDPKRQTPEPRTLKLLPIADMPQTEL